MYVYLFIYYYIYTYLHIYIFGMRVETTRAKFRQDPIPFVRSGDAAPAGGLCLPTKVQPRPARESTQPARHHGDLESDFITVGSDSIPFLSR